MTNRDAWFDEPWVALFNGASGRPRIGVAQPDGSYVIIANLPWTFPRGVVETIVEARNSVHVPNGAA